jgi:hypothetical protein
MRSSVARTDDTQRGRHGLQAELDGPTVNRRVDVEIARLEVTGTTRVGEDVGSVCYATEDGVVLIGPIVPPEGRAL